MKAFIRTQLPWLLLELTAIFFIILLFWLDGYRNIGLILYAWGLIMLGTLFFLVFLFVKDRSFYRYLETGNVKGRSTGFVARKWQRWVEIETHQWLEKIKQIDDHHQEHIKFMNIWVHQMKTPLAVLELLAESESMDSFDVLEEVDRLHQGLTTALSYTRLEDFSKDFVIEEVSVLQSVHQAIGKQKRNFIRHQVYPKIYQEKNFLVMTDKKWLDVLLSQLISNAIKYSKKQQQVIVELFPETKMIQITDFGCGIAKADLPRVFRPFFTGENGRNSGEATGMGLYIASQIAHELTIDLQIESVKDKGTIVTIIFL